MMNEMYVNNIIIILILIIGRQMKFIYTGNGCGVINKQ